MCVARNNPGCYIVHYRSRGDQAASGFPLYVARREGLGWVRVTWHTQENLLFCLGRQIRMNRVLHDVIWGEASKLVRRHQRYASDLASNIRRKERRSGQVFVKEIRFPQYWKADEGFNPYHVRAHAEFISYAIDKALKTQKYRPRPAVKYTVPKSDGGSERFRSFKSRITRFLASRLSVCSKNIRGTSAHMRTRTETIFRSTILFFTSPRPSNQRVESS